MDTIKLFISYRHDDSSGYAGRLYDRLSQHYGAENVFMDIAKIPIGEDFAEFANKTVKSCDALIALIGKRWLKLRKRGKRRLDDPEDFVRVELLTAFNQKVLVIPVLINSVTMPRSEDLPKELTELSRRQGLKLNSERFHRDVDMLIEALNNQVTARRKKTKSTKKEDLPRRLFPFKQKGSIGFKNHKGEIVIKARFNKAEYFYEGLAAADGGFIATNGEFVIKSRLRWFQVTGFSEGLAAVRGWRKWGFIDKTGELVVKMQFDEAGFFQEGLAAVKVKDTWGFVDKTGTLVVAPKFEWVSDFSEGLAVVLRNGKCTFIDETGKFPINWQSEKACFFKEGLAAVQVQEKWGYIDKTGLVAIKPQFDFALDFSERRAAVKTKEKWGYIDKTGRLIIKSQFAAVRNFSEGLAAVEVEQKLSLTDEIQREWGFVDNKGHWVIQPKYDKAWSFIDGLAEVSNGKDWGIVDKTGRFKELSNVHDPRLDQIFEGESKPPSDCFYKA